MAEYLRDAGYRVIEASNVAEAVAIMGAGESLDAVFTDCNMPGRMNGIDLALWVRRSYPDIKVLMISGASDLIHVANTA
jgi:CheY-like chemotaxis protein